MAKKKAESPVLFEKKTGSTSKPAAPAKPAAKAKAAAKPKAVKSAKAGGGGAGEKAKTPAKGKAPAVKKSAGAPGVTGRAFSTAEIGLVAGDVWCVLSEQGTKTAAELTKAVGAPAELVAAALGWLAREDKLAFETNGRSVTVSLV